MTTQTTLASKETQTEASLFSRPLVALDASEYADAALAETVRLAGSVDGVITGIHAYAAQLHDRRFRQMEGGLPDRYLQEEEMEYQRDVHDDLITRGLSIITDSYHDAGQKTCDRAGVPFKRLSPEGKNYKCIVDAMESGDFTMIALGALGLGVVPGGIVGTVCERVVRRSPIDVLVIRDPGKAIGDGPIVVGIDGSARSFGTLKTAFEMAGKLKTEIHAIAAYDPYYHYVAFNKIAGVLSDEAGKVFRFKEQEQLHEELIDEGIAKIYQSHLDIAARLAEDEGVPLTCKLLDGKPYDAIVKYLAEVNASLLMVGKTGVHADAALDIGGNAENLLRLAPCHLWLGQRQHIPPSDVVAEKTISWSNEAEAFLSRAPSFAQGMARSAVIRKAQEQGHTFITKSMVVEVAKTLMPADSGCPIGARKKTAANTPVPWSAEAEALLAGLEDASGQESVRLRAGKKARREGSAEVLSRHVRPFLKAAGAQSLPWAAAALARLANVPEAVRDQVRERVEALALEQGAGEVTTKIAEVGFAQSREAMHGTMIEGGHTKTLEDGF